MRLELREEVALELAEQTTAASAVASVATGDKEVQTDKLEPEPAVVTPETVPVAPPPPDESEVSEEHSHSNRRLASQDRELLKSCIEEMRNLTSLLAGLPGVPVGYDRSGASPAQLESVVFHLHCTLDPHAKHREKIR